MAIPYDVLDRLDMFLAYIDHLNLQPVTAWMHKSKNGPNNPGHSALDPGR